MPYWQLFYHLVWSTKNRQPLLIPTVESHIYGHLASKAVGLRGVVYAIGGVEDHVHMVVSVPPAISVAKFVGQVKGVASTKFNKSGVSDVRFEWQDEYGAFSFDAKRLPNYIAYVEQQKKHHKEGTTIPILERASSENVGPRLVREGASSYALDMDVWRAELMVFGDESQFTDTAGA
ncbi:MAG TPA: IS200/IS605 family transposase [Chloroflexi bacterium]|nr:IS200/IS605 family transposase [Chloroflexota bacterium]